MLDPEHWPDIDTRIIPSDKIHWTNSRILTGFEQQLQKLTLVDLPPNHFENGIISHLALETAKAQEKLLLEENGWMHFCDAKFSTILCN